MTCLTISTGGDCLFTGPLEEALRVLRTNAFADRVVSDTGILLAVPRPYDIVELWKIAGGVQAGSPDVGVA